MSKLRPAGYSQSHRETDEEVPESEIVQRLRRIKKAIIKGDVVSGYDVLLLNANGKRIMAYHTEEYPRNLGELAPKIKTDAIHNFRGLLIHEKDEWGYELLDAKGEYTLFRSPEGRFEIYKEDLIRTLRSARNAKDARSKFHYWYLSQR